MANFSDALREQVWEKATIVAGYDPRKWRKDFAGAWIGHDYYGKTGNFGWEIDHMKPQVLGGSDNLDNLNALHWQNNRSKGDNYPTFSTTIKARDNRNEDYVQNWRIA